MVALVAVAALQVAVAVGPARVTVATPAMAMAVVVGLVAVGQRRVGAVGPVPVAIGPRRVEVPRSRMVAPRLAIGPLRMGMVVALPLVAVVTLAAAPMVAGQALAAHNAQEGDQ